MSTKAAHHHQASNAANARPRYRGKLARARSSMNRLLAQHIRYSANGRKVVSHATINDRHKFFSKMLRDLHALELKLTEVHNFKPKHAQALIAYWESQGASASSLQKRVSYLRLLCRWIGKPGLIRDPLCYLQAPDRYQRTVAARQDKSWDRQGIDTEAVIARIESKDAHVAILLQLVFAFGLRLQEAALFRPCLDDHGPYIDVIAGTKGGRRRQVPVETEAQRALLVAVRAVAETTGRSMIPRGYTLKQWLRHTYYVLQTCGVSRRQGLVAHGGRHQYANQVFETLTGEVTAVRGGNGGALTREQERAARREVSKRLGHAREAITAAYCGPVMTGRCGVAGRTDTDE